LERNQSGNHAGGDGDRHSAVDSDDPCARVAHADSNGDTDCARSNSYAQRYSDCLHHGNGHDLTESFDYAHGVAHRNGGGDTIADGDELGLRR
jgi:hypothetical protein